MKRKIINIILLFLVCALSLVTIILLAEVREYKNMNKDLHFYKDSVSNLDFIRENEQLPYFRMELNKVLSMLPAPSDTCTCRIVDDAQYDYYVTRPYYEKLIGTDDTILVKIYFWKFDMPQHSYKMWVSFQEIDSTWIATDCYCYDMQSVNVD